MSLIDAVYVRLLDKRTKCADGCAYIERLFMRVAKPSGILLTAILLGAAWQPLWGQEAKLRLFKVITVKDEIVIGLNADEINAIGADAGAVAHALAQKGDLTVWQYNVRRGQNGELQQAPTAKIGLIANSSLRVEPYATTYAVVPHQ